MDIKKLATKLSEPFPFDKIEWRIQQNGIGNKGLWAMVIPYVDARAIQDRLDELLGIDGWKDEYEQWNGGTVCKLSIKFNDEWITKWDGSPETDIEAFKGGFSKALVRSAVKYGMGRYLYDTPTTFADCQLEKPTNMAGWNKAKFGKGNDAKWGYWKTPNESALKNSNNKTSLIETTAQPETTTTPKTKIQSTGNITKDDLKKLVDEIDQLGIKGFIKTNWYDLIDNAKNNLAGMHKQLMSFKK